MLKRLAIVLCLAFAIGPLAGGAAHAGTTCDTAYTIGKKAGIFPLYMHQQEVEETWRYVCANTP